MLRSRTRHALAAILLGLAPWSAAVASTIVVPRCGNPPCGAEPQYSTLDSALAAARPGDRIHLQNGLHQAPPGGWKITKSVEIFGDGCGEPIYSANASVPKGTILRPASPNDPCIVLDPDDAEHGSLLHVSIHDLQISAPRTPSSGAAASNGIECRIRNSSGRVLGHLVLARLLVCNMGNDGIHLEGNDSTHVIGVDIEDCRSLWNQRHGLVAQNGNAFSIRGGEFAFNGQKGAYLSQIPAVHVVGGTFQSNEKSNRDTNAPAQVFLEGCQGFLVTGCNFESFAGNGGSSVLRAVTINSVGGYVGSNTFYDNRATRGSTGIYIGYDSRGVVVGPNNFTHVDKLVEIADTDSVRSCVVEPQTSLNYSTQGSRVVAPEAPDRGHVIFPSDASGNFNVTAGIALPPLTKARRDDMKSPAQGGNRRKGLLLYNDTSRRLDYWDGASWRDLPAYFPRDTSPGAAPGGMIFPALTTTAEIESIPPAYRVYGALIFDAREGVRKFKYWDGPGWREVGR